MIGRIERNSSGICFYSIKEGQKPYDCVIPVVGTGDDFHVVDLIKHKFGLNPLLVTYNTHFNKVGLESRSTDNPA